MGAQTAATFVLFSLVSWIRYILIHSIKPPGYALIAARISTDKDRHSSEASINRAWSVARARRFAFYFQPLVPC